MVVNRSYRTYKTYLISCSDHVLFARRIKLFCITSVNILENRARMRLEVGRPIRVDYFFSRAYLKADANFGARYVRLSFERRNELSLQTKRYWLVWDATTVSGLLGDGQRALVR